ncbi:hypothetical protein [Devosia sediminis]|uniref:Uncharacterized protein n=1 Tax=Devosia sediminis TaxID=2798801 RepID=A0A934IWC1_9HYPH|nr:hypothetical protein [Devosia sediminis]MBJ3784210.1 hypothetical protein [Devosia sediminis]
MRPVLIGFVVVAGMAAAPATALDTVRCADADGEITFTYVTGPALVQPVLGVEMQMTDDFGISTDPDHPDHDGEYVSRGFIGEDVEGGDVSWRDEDGREHLAMSFRIGRVYEAQRAQVGGVVAVAGGGLWTVTCTSSDLGM